MWVAIGQLPGLRLSRFLFSDRCYLLSSFSAALTDYWQLIAASLNQSSFSPQ
jgi:hypothetical protein